MTMEHLEIPDFPVPPGWSVTARPPCSSFKDGEDGQGITIESFDGSKLCWTVHGKKFFAVGGENLAELAKIRQQCGRPMPAGAFFQARKEFRGDLHFECKVDPVAGNDATAKQLAAAAKSWIHKNAAFQHSYEGKLTKASPTSPSLYNCGIGTPSSFGIKFSRPVTSADTAAELQACLQFMTMEQLAIPDFQVPDGWSITARPPCSSFRDGDDGQRISIDSFDGKTLCWTVHGKKFFAVGGVDLAEQAKVRMACGIPMPEGAYFQVREQFRGNLYFKCTLA
eukprot:TRINITY_DN14543_c0_g1_i2.p1 TRINITY_DN14543_c0_g1~~TRINITY_DN14543_c0_g1_i2.p1  ORF type:complete len:281 (+),score=63.53 TRINITY_DN14543_c0_g1_i2:377-1219(+)